MLPAFNDFSRDIFSQCKQPWCQEQQGKQTRYNIGIYYERIYHLLDDIKYIILACPYSFRSRTSRGLWLCHTGRCEAP